ncbi:unnamed protein product [Malus baccata var. baccata]
MGSIPKQLSSLLNLKYLWLDGNNLTETIPPWIGNISLLSILYLGDNNFQGSIPNELGHITGLEKFLVHINDLSGIIPSPIYNISSISTFFVGVNQLHGELPPNLDTMLPNLIKLHCCTNKFRGNIPISLSNASRLQVLELSENGFSGTFLGESLGNLRSLIWLNIHDNQLGNRKVANLSTQPNVLSLGGNFIHGNLHKGIGNLINLTALELEDNHLSGNVSHEIGKLEKLKELYLDVNQFSGSIPSSLGNMTSLLYINNLLGEIPRTLDCCTSLEYLYLQSNKFEGTIPQSLQNLKGLEKLDISSNDLSGPIPEFIGKLGALKYLNLSYNDFEAKLPKDGIFANGSGVSVLGNHRLCSGIPQLHLPPCPPKKHHSSRGLHSPKVVIPIACVLGIIIALSCFCGACSMLEKSRDRLVTSHSYKDWKSSVSSLQLAESTNKFSVDNLIGFKSFGYIYKGVIPNDGTVVAVKVLNLQQQGASKSFINECKALRSIRHHNLLKIITACSSIDNQGKDFKSLVFEFMAKGSLDSTLYPRYKEESPSKRMSFMQRLNIAIDVASALDYLHHFKLHTTYCMYVLTEYDIGGQVSILGDVYSYGILLCEIFTGKRPIDDMFKGGLTIYQFVALALPDHVMDVIDHSIILNLETDGGVNNDITLLMCNVTKGTDVDGRGCQKNERNQGLLPQSLRKLEKDKACCSKEKRHDHSSIIFSTLYSPKFSLCFCFLSLATALDFNFND